MTQLVDALERQRTAIVVVVLLLLYLSTQMLFQPGLLDFWTPLDLLQAWGEYLAELTATALAMAIAYAVSEFHAVRRRLSPWPRLSSAALAMYVGAVLSEVAGTLLRNRSGVTLDPSIVLNGAVRWAVIGVYVVVIRELWRRVRDADARLLGARGQAEAMQREREEFRLQFLRAQVEPHFLFNTLANVRRLYRTEPERGAQLMAGLKRYLQVALPGVRRADATLADELALVRAYLELIAVRMGPRLRFEVRDDAGAEALPFPPMVLLTLVENAVRHGVEPAPGGGRIDVRAARAGASLQVSVVDDGVGLGGAPSSGTGMGLANVRARLHSAFGAGARLEIIGQPRGVAARVCIPI